MNAKTKTLLIMAVKTMGLHTVEETLSFVEESLTASEQEAAEGFLTWVLADKDHRSFGYGNLDERIRQWKASK